MNNFYDVLSPEEIAVYTIRQLFRQHGYSQYKMSKFEEYDLYADNKDFLISEKLITFTDTDGRLLALKPDVTLSIIKNTRDKDGTLKLCYDESVYRVSGSTRSFREITQVGLECIGDVGTEEIAEVVELAVKSLDSLSESGVLEISHLGIISGALSYIGATERERAEVFSLLSDKNRDGLSEYLLSTGKSASDSELIASLADLYGAPGKVVEALDAYLLNEETKESVEEMKSLIALLEGKGVLNKITIDFSVVNDMSYYNGFAIKGFIEGVPTSVLSGGQYDKLMKKMDRRARGIGFAVYLDEIGRGKNA